MILKNTNYPYLTLQNLTLDFKKSTVQLYLQIWKPPPTPHPRLFWLHSLMNRIEHCPSHAVPLDLNCPTSKDSFQSDSAMHVSNLYGVTAKISWQWSWDWIFGEDAHKDIGLYHLCAMANFQGMQFEWHKVSSSFTCDIAAPSALATVRIFVTEARYGISSYQR